MRTISAYCDGSVSKPRHGRAISGWVIIDDTGHEAFSGAKIVEDGTDLATVNTAEYSAVLLALQTCIDGKVNLTHVEEIKVHTDSSLVVNQLSGVFACNKPHLNRLKEQVNCAERELLLLDIRVTYTWIPRELNTVADKLSKSLHNSDFGKKKGKR